MNFFIRANLYFKRPKVIIVTGRNSFLVTDLIFQVLSQKLKIRKVSIQNIPLIKKNETLIIESKAEDLKSINFLIKNSKSPTLLITNLGDIPSDTIFFTGEKKAIEDIMQFTKILPKDTELIFNFDDEGLKDIKNLLDLKISTYGFGDGSDFLASDIKFNHVTNFKLNHQGNSVPIWLCYSAKKEDIYNNLAVMSVSTIFNLNLIEVSQILKDSKIYSKLLDKV